MAERVFTRVIRAYCADRAIPLEVRSHGWIAVIGKGEKRRIAYGYDLGLNSSVAHRLVNDKAATAELLEAVGVACVPHRLFLSPRFAAYAPASDGLDDLLRMFDDRPRELVVKPNEGTSGYLVMRVSDRRALEQAASHIFALDLNLAASPFIDIAEEVRVIVLDGGALAVYRKSRTADWRHNLDAGAEPVLLDDGKAREACVALAVKAAQTMGMRFCSVDVVLSDNRWRVLEINSGVMMEVLHRHHPALVEQVYRAALDSLFAQV